MAELASSSMQGRIAANSIDDVTRRVCDLNARAGKEIRYPERAARAEGLDGNDPGLKDRLIHDEITAAIKRIQPNLRAAMRGV